MTAELEPVAPLEGRGRFLRVVFDLVDRCNLRCIQCYFSLPGRDARTDEIALEEFERLADGLLPYVSDLGLSCAAEPLMYRRFSEVLAIVSRHDVPHVYFSTNGTLLTEDSIEAILQARVNALTVSFDGASKETFETIRRRAVFDRVVANLCRLRDRKLELGAVLPRVHLNMTLMRSNIAEVENWARLARQLGAEGLELRHMVPYEGLDTAGFSLNGHRELCNRQLARLRVLAPELGLALVNCPPDFELPGERQERPATIPAPPEPASRAAEAPRRVCRMPWSMIQIRPDGGVSPCTNWCSPELMGNVREQSFEEIWNGPELRRLRREHLTGELRHVCRICPASEFGSVDREESFEVRKA